MKLQNNIVQDIIQVENNSQFQITLFNPKTLEKQMWYFIEEVRIVKRIISQRLSKKQEKHPDNLEILSLINVINTMKTEIKALEEKFLK